MQATDVVKSYFDALNTEDWPTFAGLWAPDGEFTTVGARPRRGGAEIGEFLRGLFTHWATHDDQVVRILAAPDGSHASVEVRFVGTTPDGGDVTFEAVDLFDFADDGIARVRSFYDLGQARKLIAGGAGATS
jgi:uncharacterized protein (TIGR02246 family)